MGINNGIGESVDRKFRINAFCLEHGHGHDEDTSVLFLAKDKALSPTLEFYRRECQRLGALPLQLKGIDLLILRVIAYQEANPKLVKVADVDDEDITGVTAPNRNE